MMDKILRLLESIKFDLRFSNQKDICDLAINKRDFLAVKDLCKELENGYGAESTMAIRARFILNLINHLELEEELERLYIKSDNLNFHDKQRLEDIAYIIDTKYK